MLPNPVYPLGRFIPKICRIKVSAQEKYENNAFSVCRSEVIYFDRFFLPALVHVGEIAGRLGFNEDRQMRQSRLSRLDYGIDGNLDRLGLGLRRLHKNIKPKTEGACLHPIERSRGGMRLQFVAALS